MDYFGIIKLRRVRKVYSKTKGKDVDIHDYVIETINSDTGQNFAFSANEEKNKTLVGQGMVDGALGTMHFFSRSRAYTGKDGIEVDFNDIYPTRFTPYKHQTKPAKSSQTEQTNFTAQGSGDDNPPF